MENEHNNTTEKQSLKDKLMAIILLETSKDYMEMDSDLVSECVDFLMELEGNQRLTKEEIEQRVNEIPFKGRVTAIGSCTKKKVRAKRLAVIAAILAAIIALFGIVGLASGDSLDMLLQKFNNAYHDLFKNGPLELDGITIYNDKGAVTFSSIYELVEAEEIEILYPSWLPENEKIINVIYMPEEDTETYIFQCNNPIYSISVKINGKLSEGMITNWTEKIIGDLNVYYFKGYEGFQANFIYKDKCYSVNSDTEENLFKIIENLKEIK